MLSIQKLSLIPLINFKIHTGIYLFLINEEVTMNEILLTIKKLNLIQF